MDNICNDSTSSMPKLKRSLSELSDKINKASSPRKRSSTTSLSSTSLSVNSGINTILQEVDSEVIEGQWFQRFSPKTIEELALHKRKLEDVRKVMEEMISGRSEKRILLLSGPAGCSKSTCVKVLSDFLVPKWRSANNFQITGKKSSCWIEYLADTTSSSPVESFGEFLSQSKYFTNSNVTVLLVEDLPNIFHENTLLQFRESLLQWLFYEGSLPPLIISLSECHLPEEDDNTGNFSLDRNFIAETIFGKDILNHSRFARIKFNPINTSLMTRTLKLVMNRVKNEVPADKYNKSSEFIRQLAAKCGDLRSAINKLQMWCISNIKEYDTLSTRQPSTELFHAIGKVVHGSKDFADNFKLIESLINDRSMTSSTLKLGTLENYSKYNKGEFSPYIAEVIAECLSESDLIDIKLSESLYYSLAKVRYELSLIPKSSTSIHGQPNFPRDFRVQNERKKFSLSVEDFINVEFYKYNHVWTKNNIAIYGGFYGPDIRRKLNFKAKSLRHYMDSLGNERSGMRSDFEIDDKNAMFLIDENDILDRLGGDLDSMKATIDVTASLENVTHTDSLAKNIWRKLERLKAEWEKRRQFSTQDWNKEETPNIVHEHEFEDDPIADSNSDYESCNGQSGQIIDDEGDSELYEILSQKPMKAMHFSESIDLSDSDLENL